MKIAYVLMQYPVPSETFISLEIEELLKKDIEIQIFCLKPKHKNFLNLLQQRHKHFQKLQISCLSIKNFLIGLSFMILNINKTLDLIFWLRKTISNKKDFLKTIFLLPSIFYIFFYIRKEKNIDILHFPWGHYPVVLTYLLNKYGPNIPYTITFRAYDLGLKYKPALYLALKAFKIVTICNENKQILKKWGIPEKLMETIYDGIKIENMENINKHLKFPLIFLSAGRLIEEKGYKENLLIFKDILKEFPNSIMYIIGSGPYKKELINLSKKFDISKNVIFKDFLPQKELFRYMKKAHFFLFMTKYPNERIPNVLKEAMLRQCICVTTPSICIDELIKHKKNGLIFENYKIASKTLINLLKNNPSMLERIMLHAPIIVKEKFNISKTIKKYINIWKEAINERKNSFNNNTYV